MKIHKYLIIALLLPMLGFSQKDELMLGLSIGLSQPLGEFASNEYSIDDEGNFQSDGQFAKQGLAFDFSASYRLGYYFGFAGRLLGGTNKVDTKTYTDAINKELAAEKFESTISSKGWGNGGVYLGAYLVIPINKVYIDARIMAGYLNLFSPEIRYYIYTDDIDNSELFIREKYSAGGFSYDIGLGMKYKFSSNKFLLLNGDYVASKISKENISTLNPFTQEQELVNMDIDYQNLTFTIGVGYIF
mgnify:CR=1 FL=1